MATDVKALDLYPAERFDEAYELYGKAYDAFEDITFGLQKIVQRYEETGEFPETIPTPDYVGRVFSLLDGMRLSAQSLDTEIARLEKALSLLDGMRLDHTVRER